MHRRLSKVEIIISRSPIQQVLNRHKRHADTMLYRVLADCLEISEVCLGNIDEYEILNGLIKKLPAIEGKNRQYVESSSDIYQRVCRFMFHGEEHTANTNRYAITLREAAEQGLKSGDIIKELCDGGIAKFFLKRPGQNREIIMRTKCLRLDRQIAHSRRATFTLRLRRKEKDGTYEVLGQSGNLDPVIMPIAHGTETSGVEASKPALQATEVKI